MTTGKKVKKILKNGEFVPAKTRVAMTPGHSLLLFAAITVGCASISQNRNPASANCSVDKQLGCKANQVCMNVSQNQTDCRDILSKPEISFLLPFDKNSEVVCTHSSGIGSHSWPNAFYSLDLATDYAQTASIVRASADGKVFLFGKKGGGLCPESPGSPERTQTDNCGQGWGNHIKILHKDGYYSFYVHLKNFLVKNGQSVKAGQPIGTEGATGLAGHRHLHWSIQKLPGNSQKEWEERISWDGESVPFSFEAIMDGKKISLDASTLKCAHANIGQAPSDQQPRLKGTYEK